MQEKLLYLQVKSERKAAKNREFEWVSKMAQKKQKRENLERTERTQERTTPLFPPTFQALSKYYWRELLHLSSAVDQKAQRGVSDDYRKILQRDFAAIP